MKKFKKIFTAAIAAAITISATSAAVYAYDVDYGNYCEFRWGSGYAELFNNKDFPRYVSVRVDIVNEKTKEIVDYDKDFGITNDYRDSKKAYCPGYSAYAYTSKCKGEIHSAGSTYSPIDSTFNERA